MLLRVAVAPVLAAALASHDEPVDVLSVAAQAVAMGDDVHVRTQAATNLLLKTLLPALVGSARRRRDRRRSASWWAGRPPQRS